MISKILLFFASVTIFAQTPAPAPAEKAAPKGGSESAIKAVLYRQQEAWNRGDTETFLKGYDQKTVFVGDKVTRGLDEVRVRYQTRYPTVSSMGHLTFSDLEVHMLGVDHAYVIGHWRLERKPEAGGEVGGVYTLVFARTAQGWKIVLDHTS
jgi:uncharacterized protein (TIGR02246 family)